MHKRWRGERRSSNLDLGSDRERGPLTESTGVSELLLNESNRNWIKVFCCGKNLFIPMTFALRFSFDGRFMSKFYYFYSLNAIDI